MDSAGWPAHGCTDKQWHTHTRAGPAPGAALGAATGGSLPLGPAVLPNVLLLFVITELQLLGVVHFLVQAYIRSRAGETEKPRLSATLGASSSQDSYRPKGEGGQPGPLPPQQTPQVKGGTALGSGDSKAALVGRALPQTTVLKSGQNVLQMS